MKKRNYETPKMEVMMMEQEAPLLAGSYNGPSGSGTSTDHGYGPPHTAPTTFSIRTSFFVGENGIKPEMFLGMDLRQLF